MNFKSRKKNHSGASKYWDRKGRLAEAPAEDSASNQIEQGSSRVGPQPWRSQNQTL
jgi:ribosomal protein L4